MAAPFEAVMALASGAALAALGLLFVLLRHPARGPGEAFVGAFALLWGIQAVLANLGRVLEDPAVHRWAFFASLALLPPAYLFLAHAALREAPPAWARPAGLAVGGLAAAAGAVLVLAPGWVLVPGAGFGAALGPAAVPLFFAPFFGAFYLALAAYSRAHRRAPDAAARHRARGVLLALALVTSYLALRQSAVYLAPPPGIPAPGGSAAALALLFLAGLGLVLGLAAREALRPAGPRRDLPLLAAFAAPLAWAAGEVALAGPEGPADSVGLWRLAAIAALVLHRHHLDLLDAMEARERLQEAERVRELAAMKATFINAAAHELRTPLTAIGLQTALLRRGAGDLPERHRHSVGVLARNVDRLTGIVDDVVHAARAQGPGFAVRTAPLDLARVVREAAEPFRARAREQGVALEVRAPGPVPVLGDAPRLEQVVANLLDNALRFTPAGGRVAVEVERQRDMASVRVRDSGLGVAREDLGKLFQPFAQAHDAPVQGPRGSGLGLFVCRGIVEAHGGLIAAASDGPGKGSAFTFALPLAPAGRAASAAPGFAAPPAADGEDPPAPVRPGAGAPRAAR